MKELLVQYAAYNLWANTRLLETILLLSEEEQSREIKSSFNSLFKTILHLWDAESMWWQRMKLEERIMRPSENFSGTMIEASEGLLQQGRQWHTWLVQAQEYHLQHEFIYQNTKKEHFKQEVCIVLLHVFNHSTYHRGQLVNMLRQLGQENIPQTDFVFWSRKKG
jgi:uncharacterized damage-inducible protein DinB